MEQQGCGRPSPGHRHRKAWRLAQRIIVMQLICQNSIAAAAFRSTENTLT
jgi:hypothetical protein